MNSLDFRCALLADAANLFVVLQVGSEAVSEKFHDAEAFRHGVMAFSVDASTSDTVQEFRDDEFVATWFHFAPAPRISDNKTEIEAAAYSLGITTVSTT
ncbi:hypothetical protein [Fulvimarina pelagi]|uniref:hypothetical protein n=1 Tax=Fulvimarina pelagi TaxID=217511 RepID=UPI0011D07498|nr:hypothetical protein [Fulvimarina pelagi]